MTINRTKGINGGTHYEYPTPHYDAYKVVFGPVYEGGMEKGAKIARSRKSDDEFIVVGVKDVDATQFLLADGYVRDGVTYAAVEIDQTEAEDFGEEYTEVSEKVNDQIAVNTILAKIGKGEELTQNDKDALNPNKTEVPGIVNSKAFVDSLQEALDNN